MGRFKVTVEMLIPLGLGELELSRREKGIGRGQRPGTAGTVATNDSSLRNFSLARLGRVIRLVGGYERTSYVRAEADRLS